MATSAKQRASGSQTDPVPMLTWCSWATEKPLNANVIEPIRAPNLPVPIARRNPNMKSAPWKKRMGRNQTNASSTERNMSARRCNG